jgi:membrane protein YdbS with pleckstrin-like domain
MKDFDHLMSVWQEQPAHHDKLSVDNVLKQVKKDVGGLANKLRWNITAIVVLLSLTVVALLFLVFSWAAYAGMLIIIACMLLYFSLLIRHYRILNRHDATMSPTDYLVSLHQYQKERAKTVGWFYYIYVLLIGAGLLLYLFEITASYSIAAKIMVYGITVTWLLFCTFYLKRRIFMHEQEKLNVMIDRLERLKSQFE